MAYHEIDGALFRDEPKNDGKRYPVMHLALEVLGVKMQVAVWPAETSKAGVKYWPVSGSYARGESKRLLPVDVAAVDMSKTLKATPDAPGAPTQEGAADGGDLPF